MARSSLPKHLLSLRLNSDKIFTTNLKESITQKEEIKLRKKVAEETNIKNYFKKIEKSHSIPVMDYEVNKFIQNIPQNGNILDVGGCWGWHWRNIDKIRPDIKVTIIDLISVNLKIASETLEDKINKNIFLVNGDATNMPFPKESFDAVWTVQALQHIYHFQKAIEEIYRL